MNTISLAGTQFQQINSPIQTGDLLQGKLTKVDAEGTATIRTVGGEVEAKLNAPLEVGKSYLFQVQRTENELVLKVLSTPNTDVGRAVDVLLKQLALEKGGWEQRLLQLAIKEGWLQSNGSKLSLSLQWLGNSSSPLQDIKVLEFMNRAPLPFTKEVFQSLSTVFSGKGVSFLLQGLANHSQVSPERIQPLMSTLEEKMGLDLIKTALTPSVNQNASRVAKQIIAQIIQLPGGTTGEDFFNAEQLFRKITTQSRLQIWESGKQAFLGGNRQEGMMIWRSVLPNVQATMNSDQVSQLFLQYELETEMNPAKLARIETYLKQETSLSLSQPVLQWLGKSMLTHGEGFKNFPQSDYEFFMSFNREHVVKELKQIVSMLGLNLEADMASARKEGLESLKAQLIQLMHQDGVPQKLGIQELLSHLQGQKLLTQDTGPILQIFSQIPLSFVHGLNDATIYWSGKKSKEEKIDPHHCRVLFHLHLEKLGETLLDFQVQNQVAKIHVFHRLEGFIPPAEGVKEMLKTGLNKIGYHLSSFQFQYVADVEKEAVFKPVYERIQMLSKVDIRI
ncbi:hypothetical protein GCM10008967_22880 [Bacillus carboniphilus]|uniref:Glycosyltransferase n=1 Tax=Bacillus carboniphilus TaxID=86663 RepID=A0ABP3G1Q2_9BACI